MSRYALIAAVSVLAGCSSSRTSAVTESTQAPVTHQQLSITLQASSELRDRFNNSACSAIFNEASGSFRSLQRERDWLADCAELRETLGAWRSFDAQSSIGFDRGQQVLLDGHASFEKASRTIEIGWSLDGGRAKLLWLVIENGSNSRIIIPGGSGRIQDPPPPDGRQLRRA